MKRKWTLWRVFCCSGIPWLAIAILSFYYMKVWYYEEVYRRTFSIRRFDDVKGIFICAGCLWAFILFKNFLFMKTDKKIGLFTWLDKFTYVPPEISKRKKKAQHPPVAKEYLSKTPDGLVLGKEGKMFVRFPIAKGHALSTIILGTPGSGKSTLILTSLIYQLNRKLKTGEERQTYFILDVKPELLRKSTMPGAAHMRELSIHDRSKYGWDVYYNLGSCASDDDVLTELDIVARALIDAGKNEKNEFFYESARAIFKFSCLAEYKNGRSFMQTVDYLLSSSMDGLVKKVLEQAENNPELLKVKKGLVAYEGKEGEAFQGIELAFRQAMEIFQKDDTKFFFEGNPRKLSPLTLEEKTSVTFTIKSTRIKENKTLLRLVVMQLLHHCEDRDEDDSHLITLIIDEAYRLGLINWIDFLSVCRSKQVSCVLAFQSLSQMQSVWSKEDADSLLEMVSAIAVLSCASENTAKMICSWAGDFYEEKISTNFGGKNDGSYSRSYETKKILEPTDLMKLRREKEIVLFLDGEYYRVPVEKARYFMIPELKNISERCVAAHKKINDTEEE